MLRPHTKRAALLALGILCTPWIGHAETTAADAAAMRASINGFILQFAGVPAVADLLTPVITPIRDHLRLAFSWDAIGPIADYSLTAGEVTGNAHPLSGGRWAIDDLRFPSKLVAGGDPANPAGLGLTITLAEQSTSMIFDPSFATSSTFDAKLGGLSVVTQSPQGTATQRRETMEFHAVWQPRGNGRVDMREDTVETGYALGIPTKGGTPVNFVVDRVASKAEIKNFAIAEFGALLKDVMALVRAPETIGVIAGGANKPSKDMLAMARRALTVVASLMDGVDGEGTASGIHVQAGNIDVGLQKFTIALHTGVTDGALQANLPMSAEGLEIGDLVKGALKDVLPRRISLTPNIGGIDKEGMFGLLRQAIDGKLVDQAGWQAAIEDMLTNNPVSLGIDDLSVDFGVAKLEGAGELEVSSPTDLTGKAELRATGLDALIRRAIATPELKQVAPVLIFLKGIGEPDGKEMVWRVSFSDGKLSVNDTQLSDMMPGK